MSAACTGSKPFASRLALPGIATESILKMKIRAAAAHVLGTGARRFQGFHADGATIDDIER